MTNGQLLLECAKCFVVVVPDADFEVRHLTDDLFYVIDSNVYGVLVITVVTVAEKG